MILAGGRVDELLVLTLKRPKSALPFGGIYRIIDFALSNLMHSGIDNVGILSQYRPFSLMRHVGVGEHWDFIGRSRGVRILPPYRGMRASDWYKGTADAIYQNQNYINEHNPDLVLIVSGDHIYRMDYANLVDFHIEGKADLTIAFTRISSRSETRFGLGVIGRNGRLTDYREKPVERISRWASMTVYVFRKEVLYELLKTNVREPSHEFGRDIIPKALANYRVSAYKFKGFWEYSRTIDAYFGSNMLLLKKKAGFDLERWQVRTNPYERNLVADRPPCKIASRAQVRNSIISDGCIIEGRVLNSILSPGVRIEEGSEIVDSIVMHDARIGRGVVVNKTICDKEVMIGDKAICGEGDEFAPNNDYPRLLSCGITVIGKGAKIPGGIRIGRNCIIYPDVDEDCFSRNTIDSGENVRGAYEEE